MSRNILITHKIVLWRRIFNYKFESNWKKIDENLYFFYMFWIQLWCYWMSVSLIQNMFCWWNTTLCCMMTTLVCIVDASNAFAGRFLGFTVNVSNTTNKGLWFARPFHFLIEKFISIDLPSRRNQSIHVYSQS